LQNHPREKHARGEKARLSLWTCKGASPNSDALPQLNSSVEDQARRAEVHAWISRICASLPPKLFENPFAFACQQMRSVPSVFALRAISFRVITQKVRLGVVIAMSDLCRRKSNVLYGCFQVIR